MARVSETLVAQVVDPGPDPLFSHAIVNYPDTHDLVNPQGKCRQKKRPKRW